MGVGVGVGGTVGLLVDVVVVFGGGVGGATDVVGGVGGLTDVGLGVVVLGMGVVVLGLVVVVLGLGVVVIGLEVVGRGVVVIGVVTVICVGSIGISLSARINNISISQS